MRRLGGLLVVLAALGSGLSAQTMMMSSGTPTGISGMTGANTATADPVMGHALRIATGSGRKLLFTSLADAQALAAKGPTVLFFAADWCPYCQADLKDINANGKDIADVTVIVVDYDTAKELERTLGVTVQDTFVQIDAKGMKLAIWNGGGVAGIKARLVRG
jgi:thiol-disulfide isomerase/thioredoxin